MKVGDMVHINISEDRNAIGLLVNIRYPSCLADDVRCEVIWNGKLISIPPCDVIKCEEPNASR